MNHRDKIVIEKIIAEQIKVLNHEAKQCNIHEGNVFMAVGH
jgi:hypothetical protein